MKPGCSIPQRVPAETAGAGCHLQRPVVTGSRAVQFRLGLRTLFLYVCLAAGRDPP